MRSKKLEHFDKEVMQNIVFFPYSTELRSDLFRLGLPFLLVKLEGKSQFMVITNQLLQAKSLAFKHNITSFYLSDSRRQLFRADILDKGKIASYVPTKLGLLSRSEGKDFLVVTEDNSTYYYGIKPIR